MTRAPKSPRGPRLRSADISAFIAGKLEASGRMILPGLGTVRLVPRRARVVRHPASGDIYEIPPRLALVFRAARPRRHAAHDAGGATPEGLT